MKDVLLRKVFDLSAFDTDFVSDRFSSVRNHHDYEYNALFIYKQLIFYLFFSKHDKKIQFTLFIMKSLFEYNIESYVTQLQTLPLMSKVHNIFLLT